MAKAFAEIEAASDAANLGHPNGGLYSSIARYPSGMTNGSSASARCHHIDGAAS
jgi:hypothetical protein